MEYFKIKPFIFLICLIFCKGEEEFNIIELNHDVGPHTPFTSGVADNGTIEIYFPFKSVVQEAGYSRGFWLAYSEITFQNQMSTYIAAPSSYNPYGRSVDQIPFRDLFATAAVIDVRDKVAKDDSYEVTIQDVENWIEQNGMFPEHCIVIFNTGWSEGKYPNDPEAYYGGSEVKTPAVEFEALKFILDFERTHGIHFVGFGLDTISVDPLTSRFFPGQELLGERNKYIVGNLKDLKSLPPIGAKISVMPIKIKDSEGSPVRVAAQLPDDNSYYH